MIEKHVAHDAPTQARPPTQCGVDVGSADDPLSNEVINLPRQRRLQEERADLLAKEILEIADAPCKDAVEVAHARNRLDTRKWLASKLAPTISDRSTSRCPRRDSSSQTGAAIAWQRSEVRYWRISAAFKVRKGAGHLENQLAHRGCRIDGLLV